MTLTAGQHGAARRVLVVAHIPSHLTELGRLARQLASAGDEAILFMVRPWEGWSSSAEALTREGVKCLGPEGRAWEGPHSSPEASRPPGLPPWRRLARRVVRGLPPFVADRLISGLTYLLREQPFVAYRRQLGARRRELESARSLIARLRPDAIVLAEDNVEYSSAALIRAGHEHDVPSLIVPFTIATALEPAESYKDRPSHGMRRLSNWIFAKRYPQWVIEHRGRRLLRLPAPAALSAARRWPPRVSYWGVVMLLGFSAGRLGLHVYKYHVGAGERRDQQRQIIAATTAATTPGDTVLAWGAELSLNYLAARDTPSMYGYVYPLFTPGYTTATMWRRFADDLRQHPPARIIDGSGRTTWPPAPIPSLDELTAQGAPSIPSDISAELRTFLLTGYERAGTVGGFPVWVRRRAPR